MPEADEGRTAQALQAAAQCGAIYWHLPKYDREADQLVFTSLRPIAKLSGESHDDFWTSLWRHLSVVEEYAYLAFRSPRYVRLGRAFGSPELATGARLEVMQTSLPAGVPLNDRLVIAMDSHGVESCVVCESVGFYMTDRRDRRIVRSQRDLQVPSAITTTRKPPSYDANGHESLKPISQRPYFGEIEGATLAWWGFPDASLGALIMLATGLAGEPKALRFSNVRYLDCPTTMHRVRLRLSTAEESEALGQRLREPPHTLDGRHVIIGCDEGTASIIAEYIHLSWRNTWEGWWTLAPPTLCPFHRG
jgi:hypothetical protein